MIDGNLTLSHADELIKSQVDGELYARYRAGVCEVSLDTGIEIDRITGAGPTLLDALTDLIGAIAESDAGWPADPNNDVAAAFAAPGDGTSAPPASESAEDALVEVDKGPLPSGTDVSVIPRADVGAGRRYRSRTVVFDEMGVGDTVRFEAATYTLRAGVRGSAYQFGARTGRRMRCDRGPNFVAVTRLA